jgi:hypothetical protein
MQNSDYNNPNALTAFNLPGNINSKLPDAFSTLEDHERHLQSLSLLQPDQSEDQELQSKTGIDKKCPSTLDESSHE